VVCQFWLTSAKAAGFLWGFVAAVVALGLVLGVLVALGFVGLYEFQQNRSDILRMLPALKNALPGLGALLLAILAFAVVIRIVNALQERHERRRATNRSAQQP
jgi:Na+/melibiose symporter-like transporter